jgi:hypothetical protein
MEFDKTPAPAIVEVNQEASPAAYSRSRIGRVLAKGAGLGILLFGLSTASRAARHEVAGYMLENETPPEVLQEIQTKLDQKVSIDADTIAEWIAKENEASPYVHFVGHSEAEQAFDSRQLDERGRILVDGKSYYLKIGSSTEFEKHFVVAGRSKKGMFHPRLIGMHMEGKNENITLEEGQRLALQNAADNLNEFQSQKVAVQAATDNRAAFEAAFTLDKAKRLFALQP